MIRKDEEVHMRSYFASMPVCSVPRMHKHRSTVPQGPHAIWRAWTTTTMQMLCIDKWRTRCTTVGPASKNTRTCTTNAMRVEQASGSSIVSAWPWQELAQPGSTGHLQDAARCSVSCAPLLCLVKESGTSMLITYCHRRLFIHAQSWLLLASQTLPAVARAAPQTQPSLAPVAQGTSSALLAAIVLSSRRLPDVSQAQDRRRHYPSRQCSMHASNHAQPFAYDLVSWPQCPTSAWASEPRAVRTCSKLIRHPCETTGHSLRSSQSVLHASVSSCPQL
jgi:hypothetical protein